MWWGGGLRWWKAITGSKGRPDPDEGPLGIMGAWTRTDTLSGTEALSIRKQPAWRGAPSPNGGSGGRIRRAGRWLWFKSLMHQMAGQWQRGCGGGGCDRSAGEQCPVHLTDSSSGPAEAPASAPECALSSAPSTTCAARVKSRNSPSRSPQPPALPRISSIPTCPGFEMSPGGGLRGWRSLNAHPPWLHSGKLPAYF